MNDINTFTYIIDGGMLLHRVKWQINDKFSTIFDSYVKYIRRHYGYIVIIVFDGYQKETTKAAERNRRC